MISLIFLTLCIIIVIIVVIYYFHKNKKWTIQTTTVPSADTFTSEYSLPSLWDGTLPADSLGCVGYTFVTPTGAPSNHEPAAPSLTSLNTCFSEGTCSAPMSLPCIDDDQIYASRVYHFCRYGDLKAAPIQQYKGCVCRDNTITKINGYYEEFYQSCTPANLNSSSGSSSSGQTQTSTAPSTTRCQGNIGILTFNLTKGNIDISKCAQSPSFNLNLTPQLNSSTAVPTATCNLTLNISGFATQIFRVKKATWTASAGFTYDNAGPWLQIIHRPTGYYLCPRPNTVTPQFNDASDVVFVPPTFLITSTSTEIQNTYIFRSQPSIATTFTSYSQAVGASGPSIYQPANYNYIAPPQLAFSLSPQDLENPTTPNGQFEAIATITNNFGEPLVTVIGSSLYDNGTGLMLGPYAYYAANAPDPTVNLLRADYSDQNTFNIAIKALYQRISAMNSSFMFLDYPLMDMISNNIAAFQS